MVYQHKGHFRYSIIMTSLQKLVAQTEYLPHRQKNRNRTLELKEMENIFFTVHVIVFMTLVKVTSSFK